MKKYEKFMIQALMVMMAIVLGLATLDLGWLIIKDITHPPYFLLDVNQLLEIFGLFMLVVIGIELLETIMKTYITQGQRNMSMKMRHFFQTFSVSLHHSPVMAY
jgi:uncharacterized membrane protein (DUF373 family)